MKIIHHQPNKPNKLTSCGRTAFLPDQETCMTDLITCHLCAKELYDEAMREKALLDSRLHFLREIYSRLESENIARLRGGRESDFHHDPYNRGAF